jgi:predicted esterase
MRTKRFSFFVIFFISQSLICFAQMNLRGWNDAGQTWLVWEDTPPFPDTYRIYKSTTQLLDISNAENIGRIFEMDGRGFRLKKLSDTLNWTIPDGSGGLYTLKDNEALFVYTPYEEIGEYFAVLRDDNSIIGSNNQVGPIEQNIEKIQCHLQLSGIQEDFPYRVFAHWIDGSESRDSGRSDYPVMGNEHLNGIGHLFRIWEFPEGEKPELLPLSVVLHGGGGWFGRFCPCQDNNYKTNLVAAMVFCPDDGIPIQKSNSVGYQKSYWLGYWEGYNRFLLPEDQAIPDTGLVVNYTMRRLIWELDWLIETEMIDSSRISLMGGSMGARGANYLARAYPERFAAWLSLSPGIVPQDGDPLVGSAAQNLSTNLPDEPGVAEVMDLHTVLSANERDIPFGKIVGGRADKSLAALTADVIQAYENVNSSGFGCHIYWDDRGHVYTSGSHWSDSYRLTAQALTDYYSNQSFPAFFNDDQDFLTTGRQPDIRSGDPSDGDMWGTWGGYYGWDPEKIVDTPTTWKTEVFLISSSEYANDIPPFDSSKTDVAIRKSQQFTPAEGSTIAWNLKRLSDSRVLQSGQEKVGETGVITIPGIIIYKEKCELSVSVGPTAIFSRDDKRGSTASFIVLQIFPNPFSSSTTIHYQLTQPGMVNVAIYNISGQLVEILVNDHEIAGHHSITWDAKGINSGLYFCRIKTGQFVDIKKSIFYK